MGGVPLGLAPTRAHQPPHGSLDEMDRGLAGSSLLLRLRHLPRWDGKYTADHGEGELQVQVHCERPDVPEAVPDGAPDSEDHWLDLNSQSKAIQLGLLAHVGVYRAKRARDDVLACPCTN